MDTKETRKLKRAKAQTDRDTQLHEKPLKIKLTAKESYQTCSDDEDEPDPAFEEHLILRVPEGKMCDRLHEYVKKREIPEEVKLYFKDSRRGYFYIDGERHDTMLVDLPTIIESQKTLDKKQFYKIADISQMLLVDGASADMPNPAQSSGRHHTDPYMFPHGLTPPLKYVRKRRFRKKLSKRAIEEVEQEVERLLEVDATAEDVQYEVYDTRELEMEAESDVGTQDMETDASDGESESDEDLAAAIDRDLEEIEAGQDDDDDDDDNDEDEEEEESEEEDEDEESGKTSEIDQKRQEIEEISQLIERRTRELQAAPNAMLQNRLKSYIDNLQKGLALKEAQLAELKKQT